MKIKLLFLLSLVLTAFAPHAIGANSNNCPKPDFIIDVRTANEFTPKHIDGAVNLPLDQIGTSIYSLKGIRKDSRILLYCATGRRSEQARALLEKQGFRQVQNAGSISEAEQGLNICFKPK